MKEGIYRDELFEKREHQAELNTNTNKRTVQVWTQQTIGTNNSTQPYYAVKQDVLLKYYHPTQKDQRALSTDYEEGTEPVHQ